ncbi:hypothetical protein HL42_1803 [Trichophyton rubrum]|nr:hypothetical protein HL42_1803 [Trichophyton rubrum]
MSNSMVRGDQAMDAFTEKAVCLAKGSWAPIFIREKDALYGVWSRWDPGPGRPCSKSYPLEKWGLKDRLSCAEGSRIRRGGK